MKQLLTKLILSLIGLPLLLSCNKGDQTAENKFSWVYNGTTYVAKQHSAQTIGIGAPSIIAGMQTTVGYPGIGPRINLTSLNTGTYSFISNSGNQFQYIDEVGDTYIATTGSLNITKNANNYLSGNFSVTLNNNKVVTGGFENTPIK